MPNSRGHSVAAVDHALRVLLLLSERQRLRVVDVAAELGVARSTAHRLLSTLQQHEFAVQDAHKAYRPGPVFAHISLSRTANADLRSAVRPLLERLNREVDETCHLVVLEGNGARFVDCVESSQVLRTGSRLGMLLPAHTNSAGKALLAELPSHVFVSLYPRGVPSRLGAGMQARRALQRQLAEIRKRGYATNFEESAQGVTAVGACVRDTAGKAIAALAIASPSTRCPRQRIPELAAALLAACEAARGAI
jgi:IclR family transcriptional regulator, acetate operon repressor